MNINEIKDIYFINSNAELDFGLFFSGLFHFTSLNFSLNKDNFKKNDKDILLYELFLIFIDRNCAIPYISEISNKFLSKNLLLPYKFCEFFMERIKSGKIKNFYFNEYWLRLTDTLIAICVKEFIEDQYKDLKKKRARNS